MLRFDDLEHCYAAVKAGRGMSAPLGRFVLVELHEDLARHGTTSNVAKLGLKHVPGVASVTDLAAISMSTLETILRTPDYDPPLPAQQMELGA